MKTGEWLKNYRKRLRRIAAKRYSQEVITAVENLAPGYKFCLEVSQKRISVLPEDTQHDEQKRVS